MDTTRTEASDVLAWLAFMPGDPPRQEHALGSVVLQPGSEGDAWNGPEPNRRPGALLDPQPEAEPL